MAFVIINCFHCNSRIYICVMMTTFLFLFRLIGLCLHIGIDEKSNFTILLRLMKRGCAYKITVKQDSEIADCILEVAIGQLRNVC